MTKLLGISGSLRKGSFNTLLVHEAARIFDADEFQMADMDLPLYNGDVEDAGIPASVQKICAQIEWADAIVISSPEYNKGPSGVMKNMLDWVSRPRPAPMVGKPVAVVSAAAGISGGDRAKATMYLFLVPFKVKQVFQPEVSVGAAYEAFDANGRLVDKAKTETLMQLMTSLKAAI